MYDKNRKLGYLQEKTHYRGGEGSATAKRWGYGQMDNDDFIALDELAAQLGERAMILREVLDGFSHRHRALLELRLVEETAFPAIATELGYASAETARQAFCEAQAKLVVRLRVRGVRLGV